LVTGEAFFYSRILCYGSKKIKVLNPQYFPSKTF
jgi:hypothetical protein